MFLGRRSTDRFGSLTITLEGNLIYAFYRPVADQVALRGLLRNACDLGMPLLSVSCIKLGQADTSDVK